MKLLLLNSPVLTANGEFSLKELSLTAAQDLVAMSEIDSAIGHESTAQIMSELLGVTIPVNRQQVVQQPEQRALIFRLNSRPPEGKILSRQEIEAVGYSFGLLTKKGINKYIIVSTHSHSGYSVCRDQRNELCIEADSEWNFSTATFDTLDEAKAARVELASEIAEFTTERFVIVAADVE